MALENASLAAKPGGEVGHAARLDPAAPRVKDRQFVRAQDLFCKALAATREGIGNAPDVAEVGADAVDHDAEAAITNDRSLRVA
jgi:hypothetical protein